MNKIYQIINLQLFAAAESTMNVQKTSQNSTGASMSPTMKTFYDTALLENARAALIFNQFAEKQKIHGNTVEWRKFNTFDKALTPLTEGVTPSGKSFGMTKIEATTTQHGDYVTVSDRLEYEAVDDIILGATEEMGAAGGATYDTLTRNVISSGNSVYYAPRIENGVETPIANTGSVNHTCLLTPKLINKARTWLKKNHAPTFEGGYYVALIHPSVAEDLRNSDEWKEYHKYNDVEPIFKGEIGTLHGFRFIENTECRVHKDGAVKSGSEKYCVYDTLCFGKGAYGVAEPENESMKMIIKDKSQIGGPLELYSTIGYKFSHGAKILYQERLLRIESGSSYSATDDPNWEAA